MVSCMSNLRSYLSILAKQLNRKLSSLTLLIVILSEQISKSALCIRGRKWNCKTGLRSRKMTLLLKHALRLNVNTNRKDQHRKVRTWHRIRVALPAAGAGRRLHHRLQADRLFRRCFLERGCRSKTIMVARCLQHRACTHSECVPYQSLRECHIGCLFVYPAGGMSRYLRQLARLNRHLPRPLQRC